MISVPEGLKPKSAVSIFFLISRLILILSLPLEGLKSYGDYWNFYALAGLGRPFLDIWIEFPPLFPFLSRGIYLLVGGREHAYIYLSVILYSMIQAGSIYLFQQIAAEIWGKERGAQSAVIYAMLLVGLFYGWAYFDCLAVFLTLLGLYFALRSRTIPAGVILGFGGLVKWFPVLVLPAIWKKLDHRKAIQVGISAITVLVIAWGALFLISPTLTKASLISQGAKGSWESVWAILDGNLQTGNFNPEASRLDVTTASLPAGNPPLISPWITLIIFAGIGLFIFWKARVQSAAQLIEFSGLTLILFFIWSPGYSPQWVLYLIPMALLSFQGSRSILVVLTILMINLLEWPLLLSRGLFQYLPGLIILRTMIYLLVGLLFAENLFKNRTKPLERTQ
jgi:hypothetical protein